MTTYYVRKSGSDSNDGLSPAAAWLTIGKALGSSGIASGDTVYIGSGIYRELVTVNMTNPTAETFITGDVTGTYTGDAPGEIRLTNYLTDDKTDPTDSILFSLNGRDNLTIKNISFYAAYSISTDLVKGVIEASGTNSSGNITIETCSFFLSDQSESIDCIFITNTVANTSLNFTIRRCYFASIGGKGCIEVHNVAVNTVNTDVGILVVNCLFHTSLSVDGTAIAFVEDDVSYKIGGGDIMNCTFICASHVITLVGWDTALFKSVEVYNCAFIVPSPWYIFRSDNNEAIIENYNNSASTTNIWNYASNHGEESVHGISYASLYHMGQESKALEYARPFGTPLPNSPWIGFGNGDPLYYPTPPDVDILNRPRPASLNGDYDMNAVGAYERHDTGLEDTSDYDSAPASMYIAGPGDHDFELPVNAESTEVSIVVWYDTNHGTTYKPQVQILDNPKIGVSSETLTMTQGVDTKETLSFTPFTPTANGVITLRCLSCSATWSGKAHFDTITVNGA